MTKTTALLPMFLVAGALPLSAHALETIDLDPRDELSRLAVPPWNGEAGVAVLSRPYRRVSIPGARETGPQGQRPDRADSLRAAEVSMILDHARLAPAQETPRGQQRAAQLLAALAAAGLVARRRLVGC